MTTLTRVTLPALICLAVSACAALSLPKDGTDFLKLVNTWVHLQMPADEAIGVLQKQGFRVGRYPPSNAYIRDRRDWIQARASRPTGLCRSIVWYVSLALEAERVTEIKTLTRETEPECIGS